MPLLQQILQDKDSPVLQFAKYGFCGGIAFLADALTFFLVAWLLFPALQEDDRLVQLLQLEVRPISEQLRMLNFCLANAVAFLVSNLTAYLLNVRYVFKAGRHSRKKEVGLFYLVSGISWAIAVVIGVVLIRGLGLATTYSYVAKVVAATLINYAGRKFIIFHG